MVMEAGLRNDGRDPFYVYQRMGWGPGGGLALRLKDQSGREIAPVMQDDGMSPPPPKNDDPSMFVKLYGGQLFGLQRELPITDLVTAPGRYTLQIEYRGAMPCNWVARDLAAIPALWLENASLFSGTISFQVIP
jgi:hypothetical protein